MVRKAIVIGAAFMASSASAQQTKCVWVGQTLSCSTESNDTAPIDQGKILQSGMDIVPRYVAPTNTTPEYMPPVEYETIDGELAVEQCELDSIAIASRDPNHPRKKQRAFFGGYLPKNQRPQFAQICGAYMLGKIAGAKQK